MTAAAYGSLLFAAAFAIREVRVALSTDIVNEARQVRFVHKPT